MVRPVVVDDPTQMRGWSRSVHGEGRTIGLVPTMGALHEGHFELIRAATAAADEVVVSIFVNPLQFGESLDFDAYPRPLDDDLEACSQLGVDAVYAPTASTMYPTGFDTTVTPGKLATTMEATSRPGHFEGVATVVTKLFSTIRPDVAVFGEKDFQQLAIVRRMAADLDLGVEVLGRPTVREDDGLALSSRNRRLDADARRAAACVPAALDAAMAVARHRSVPIAEVLDAARRTVDAEDAATLDYVTVVDPDTLLELAVLPEEPAAARLAIAVRIGDVRLIDNVDLFGLPITGPGTGRAPR